RYHYVNVFFLNVTDGDIEYHQLLDHSVRMPIPYSCGDGRLSRVPMYPYSAFDQVQDPDRTVTISPFRLHHIAPGGLMPKAPVLYNLARLIPHLLQSLSTLHASISTYYARLASDGGLNLIRQDWLPAGIRRGVSFSLIFFNTLSESPHLMDLHGAITRTIHHIQFKNDVCI